MILTIGVMILGIVSFVCLLVILVFFGKLIKLQFRRWRLARQGYVEVEHISETNLRQYIIMKPENKSFDFFEGFFYYDPEAVSRVDRNVLKNYSKEELQDYILMSERQLNELPESDKKKEIVKIRKLYSSLKKLSFDKEALTYKYGMPVITYYGDKPEPVVFRDLKRQYPSTFIKDMYLRLLLTQRYNDFKKFITIGLIIAGVTAVALMGIFIYLKGLNSDLAMCHQLLNTTINDYVNLANQTLAIKSLGSTVVI